MLFLLACARLLLMMTVTASVASQPQGAPLPIEGDWQGSLAAGGTTLRLALHVVRDAAGALSAKFDSLDQGATGIPFDTVTVTGDVVRFELKAANAVFEGRMSDDRRQIEGRWTQGGGSAPLVLTRGLPAAAQRPQLPAKPYPYNEEQVTYQNKAAGITLAGTLTTPKGLPAPAVILITGSGAEDRDETIFGHKPFLILADHLTHAGIAVLRVDDRGVGGSSGKTEDGTSDDFAGDVIAGIEYLKGRKEIDPKRIGLIGHSEGGLIAPIVASRSADVAFIVLMAGPGIPGEEILYLQAAAIARVSGAAEAQIAENRKVQERMFEIIRTEKDPAAARERFAAVRDELVAKVPEAQKAAATAQLNGSFTRISSPWFRYFLSYDPRPALQKVKCPVLAIAGERDLQVPYAENLDAIGAALKAGGNTRVTLVHVPDLNHLFQTATTGSPAEYARIEETMAPAALKIITDWIAAQVK
jgi:pimeloyl-ACP methyl ester carboxylesterase